MILIAALLGFSGVAAGAFGAHALKERLTPDMLQVFEVGVRYQMYHALVLLGLGLWRLQGDPAYYSAMAICFLTGTLVFSGSLYALALTGIRVLGAVTPIGGALLLFGWAIMAWSAWH